MSVVKRIEKWEFTPSDGNGSLSLDVKVYQKTVSFGVEMEGREGVLDSMMSVTIHTILLTPDKDNARDQLVAQRYILEIQRALVQQGIARKDAQFYILSQAGELSDLFFVDIDPDTNTAKFVDMNAYPKYFEQRTGEQL